MKIKHLMKIYLLSIKVDYDNLFLPHCFLYANNKNKKKGQVLRGTFICVFLFSDTTGFPLLF